MAHINIGLRSTEDRARTGCQVTHINPLHSQDHRRTGGFGGTRSSPGLPDALKCLLKFHGKRHNRVEQEIRRKKKTSRHGNIRS